VAEKPSHVRKGILNTLDISLYGNDQPLPNYYLSRGFNRYLGSPTDDSRSPPTWSLAFASAKPGA
jgi:hypothetical protein